MDRAAKLRCDHCLVEFPAREAVADPDAAGKVFCCHGCLGVWRLVHEEGLGAYYATRRWDGPGTPVGEAGAPEDLAAFADAVRHGPQDQLELYVDGIRCASCVWLVERVLSRTPGVASARVNYATHRARVRWDPGRAGVADVLARVRAAGYQPRPWSEGGAEAARRAEARDLLFRLGTAAFLASQLMIYQAALYAGYFQGMDASARRLMELVSLGLALPVYFYSGAPFLRATLRGLRHGALGMDALVAVGAGAALVTSVWQMLRGGEVYFDTAVMIPTLVLLGRYVEAAARGRASEAVARLARLAPREARRLVRGPAHLPDPAPPTHAPVEAPLPNPSPRLRRGEGLSPTPSPPGPAGGEGRGEGDDAHPTPSPPASAGGEGRGEGDDAHPTRSPPASAGGEGRGEGDGYARETVPLARVAVGDLVEVLPGARVPLDGIVREGASEVDESLVTGEARPVPKAPGAAVVGGTVNQHGALVVEVTCRAGEGVLAGIVRAVEEAQERRPRVQAVADRVVAVFVPAMLVLAAGTLAVWLARGASADRAILAAISVLVIACPCALGLATPIAVLVAAGLATSRGLLVRRGDVLEGAARATDVLLDKTGTVTRGRPVLREVVTLEAGLGREDALALAAAVELRSEHHVGRAVVEAARGLAAAPAAASGFRAIPGRGVVGRVGGARVLVGNRALLAEHGVAPPAEALARAAALEAKGETVAFLATDARAVALLAVADPIRDEAPAALAALRAAGLRVRIVSGDGQATTAAVAGALGVEATAEATPLDKRALVERLQAGRRRVLFAGDGLNDAPALVQAEVGVAMGRGTDVTLESADAVLVRDDLRLVPDLVRLSRRTYAVIAQNVFWAFFYNLVAIPLAMMGLLHPIVAAGAMAASSLFVVGNSLRLRGTFTRRPAVPQEVTA